MEEGAVTAEGAVMAEALPMLSASSEPHFKVATVPQTVLQPLELMIALLNAARPAVPEATLIIAQVRTPEPVFVNRIMYNERPC